LVVRDHQEALSSLLEQRLATEQLAQKLQLELIGTEAKDRFDKKLSSWDALKMFEFDARAQRSKYFYQPKALDPVQQVYVTNAVEKQSGEETQLDLCKSDK
jgi:hypothetical protein